MYISYVQTVTIKYLYTMHQIYQHVFTSSNITANVNTKKSVVLTILYCNVFCIIDLYKACPCLHLSDQYEYHIHSQYTGTITDNCIK